MDGTNEKETVTRRNGCESVRKQMENAIVVLQIQIRQSLAPIKIQILSNPAAAAAPIEIQMLSKPAPDEIQNPDPNPDRHCQNLSAHHFVAAIVLASCK